MSIKGGIDHESCSGGDGNLNDKGRATVGEGADAHSIKRDGEFGFVGYFAKVGIDEDAAGVEVVGGGASCFGTGASSGLGFRSWFASNLMNL